MNNNNSMKDAEPEIIDLDSYILKKEPGRDSKQNEKRGPSGLLEE